jgi:hypothetical protein
VLTDSLATVRSSKSYFIGTWDRVLIEVFFESATPDGLQARLEAHKALYQRFPDRVLSLTVIRAGARLPDSEIRAEASRIVKQLAPRTQAIVVTLEGEGFWASAARSTLTAIQLLAPGARGIRVSATVPEAAKMLAEDGGESPMWAQKLEHVVDSIRT